MIKSKLAGAIALVVFLDLAATAVDYVFTVLIDQRPENFFPFNTMMVAFLVGAPIVWFLTQQRAKLQATKEQLSATIADKEQALAAAEEAFARLEDNEKLYRLLADNQSDVISLWGPGGQRKYSSPSAQRAFGFTPKELLELPDSANAHPDDLPLLREALGDLKAEHGPRSLEYRLMHRDGTALWVEGTFTRLNDQDGGLLSTTRVITERKRLEQELIHALDEAKSALAVKSDFLANMTHELRTPLNAIIGFSGTHRDSDALNATDARQVELIHDASRTLLGVVNDVLDFSKLEAGVIEPDLHPFDPAHMADLTTAMFDSQIADKGLELSVAVTGLEGPLLGDSARLRQVLLNFISNAVKFTAQGRIEVTVDQAP